MIGSPLALGAQEEPTRLDLLASVLRDRRIGLVLVGALVVHMALVGSGLPGWWCPVREGLHVPCPGCGLSRAGDAMFHGNWARMLEMHAFAPVAALLVAVVAAAGLLPGRSRRALIRAVEAVEVRTGLTLFLASAFIVYWAARLAHGRTDFINLLTH